MNTLKQTLKRVLPEPLLNAARETLDAVQRAGQWPAATFHPWRQDSMRKLAALKDSHRGQRCFLVGNGPSLQHTDLRRLKGEFSIGLNRIFLAFPELGFETSVIVSVNDLVIEQSTAEFNALHMPRFVSWRARRWLQPAPDLHFLYTTYTGPKFARNVVGRLWEGATVTYVAMQLAYHMGFDKVILIGVDHNFTTQGKPNTTITSQGDDPNHFHPGYFGKGFRWQLPDLETSERAYRMAKQAYEQAGRQIVDATVGGKLQVFPKVDYNTLF
jgi:uncharacterized Rossmann fold enzyme